MPCVVPCPPWCDRCAVEATDRDVRAAEVGLELRCVGRDDCDAPRGQCRDRLGVGARHVSTRPDQLEVLVADRRHEADVGPRDSAELADLSDPSHPHLGQSTRVSLSSRQTRERQADLVVVARFGPTVGVTTAHNAARTSFVVVFPVDPTTATTRAPLFPRTREASAASAAFWSSGTSVAAPRARASATCSIPVLSATNRSPGRQGVSRP